MSFFDIFKKSNTKNLAKKMRENTNNDPVKEALNSLISETELSNILENQQSSMLKGEKYFLDGINLAQNNKQEAAIECFSKSIDCYDGASGPFLNRGVVYHQLGMYEEAVKDYNKSVELETAENTGSLDVAKHNLALVYELIGDQQTSLSGSIRLEEAEVDVMFITKNDQVIYINYESEHLFSLDKDGDKKLDGRVVNMVFTGQSDNSVIEVFVVFDDSESYKMFTLGEGRDERLNYVAQAIFKYFVDNKIEGVFFLTQGYASQYLYTFKLYQKGARYFMINNGHSQAYLIDEHSIKRGGEEIMPEFWG